ncbi:MAG: hypothetical protein J6P46_01410, partial [Bacteroidales bacterium]|nr:hypothetical protein [Bacteroidales bacterium]
MESDMFLDSLSVSILGEGTIYYQIDGGPAVRYEGPFTIRKACDLTAWAEKDGRKSFETRSRVRQIMQDRDIRILRRYSRQYTAGGDEGLIDGTRGGLNWRTGGWQGYQATDFEAIVDLRESKPLKVIGAGFCQDAR